MYKLLCIGTCACFLLVMMMVSVLTCSGFPIDSGMTPSTNVDSMLTGDVEGVSGDRFRDSSNSQYSSTSGSISVNEDYVNGVFQVRSDRTSSRLSERTSIPVNSFEFNSANSNLKPHRLRHRRSRQSSHQQHLKSESSAPVYSSQTNYHLKELQQQNSHRHSQRISQQTITNNRKHPNNNKNHRHNTNNNNNKRRKQEKDRPGKKGTCQQQNVARKAYLANTVVLAKVSSRNLERVHNYSVTFKIENLKQHVYKKQYDVESDIRLTFLNNTSKMHCETPNFAGPVKAQIEQKNKYFLFLNSTGSHDYTVIGMPVPYKEKTLAIIKRVTNPSFVPRYEAPTIQVLTAGGTMWNASSSSGDYVEVKPGQKIRLQCSVQGFPIPLLMWKKNATRVTANNTRVIYRRKRDTARATLVIKQARPQDSGVYRCMAWYGAQGDTVKYALSPEIRISNSENNYGAPCSEKYNTTFCQNGGQCRVAEVHESVLFCICPDGFTGERCEAKSVENSMYMQKTSCTENFMC